jgi:hypothetical protein
MGLSDGGLEVADNCPWGVVGDPAAEATTAGGITIAVGRSAGLVDDEPCAAEKVSGGVVESGSKGVMRFMALAVDMISA